MAEDAEAEKGTTTTTKSTLGCLLCAFPGPGAKVPGGDGAAGGLLSDGPTWWSSVLSKICEYLLIPPENVRVLLSKCGGGEMATVCHRCLATVQQIRGILKDIKSLETKIQGIVVELGETLVVNSFKFGPYDPDKLPFTERVVWELLRKPSIESKSLSGLIIKLIKRDDL
jgi:hypothetical protein